MDINYSMIELKEENKRLSNELLFAQKCIQLLEKYRNCLKSFNNNCNCDQNINNKNKFNLLENEYKVVFNNNNKQIDYEINKNIETIDENESHLNEVSVNSGINQIFIRNNKVFNYKSFQINKNNINSKTKQNIVIKRLNNNNKTCVGLKRIKVSTNEKFVENVDQNEVIVDNNSRNIESNKAKVIESIDDNNIDANEGIDNNNNRSNVSMNKSFKKLTKETLLEGLRLKVLVADVHPTNHMISGLKLLIKL
jgi:hypothetical protein